VSEQVQSFCAEVQSFKFHHRSTPEGRDSETSPGRCTGLRCTHVITKIGSVRLLANPAPQRSYVISGIASKGVCRRLPHSRLSRAPNPRLTSALTYPFVVSTVTQKWPSAHSKPSLSNTCDPQTRKS